MSYLAPFYPKWDAKRADELLRQFNLPPGRKLKHLSRGMRMKVLLASSLAYRPRLIVLDEPFSGLDALVRDQFIEGLLESIEGATVLISSHDLSEIESFASRVGYLDEGRLLFSEEMSSLTARFREIKIIREGPLPQLPNWPMEWVNPEHSGNMTRGYQLPRRAIDRAGASDISEYPADIYPSDAFAVNFRDAGKGQTEGSVGGETSNPHIQKGRARDVA